MYPPAQYPTAPYAFPGYAPSGTTFYPPAPPQPQRQLHPQQQQQPPMQTIVVSATSAAPGINQGSWSDAETERLTKFAENSRSVGTSGEIEWDWVVHQWGTGRTRLVVVFFVSRDRVWLLMGWVCRRQILIKATALGLKESSSRGVKRRRDNDTERSDANSMLRPTTTASVTNATAPNASTSTIRPSTSESPIPSRAALTPGASPVVQNQTRPPGQSSTPIPRQQQQPTDATHSMPWPMPTVAASTPSLMVVTSDAVEPQRTSYYGPK